MMDEFTEHRYNELAKGFVELYSLAGEMVAAKMLYEERIPEQDLPTMRSLIERQFLSKGWTFNEGLGV